MWSSRNKILMDTDGDDVAFLSGSGALEIMKSVSSLSLFSPLIFVHTNELSHLAQ